MIEYPVSINVIKGTAWYSRRSVDDIRLCLSRSMPADLRLETDGRGEYRVIGGN